MGTLKKSTPHKSQTKIIPDASDGTRPYVHEKIAEDSRVDEFPDDSGVGKLSLDIFQTAEEIVVVAPIAGVAQDDLSIAVTDEVLTIKGSRTFSFKAESTDYFTQECFWGDFSRSIILPESVDTSKVKASFKNGILTVRIPKVEKVKTRMIVIKKD